VIRLKKNRNKPNMGLQSNTRKELKKETVNKNFAQPKDGDLTTLEKKLIAITASIPTMLGGGNHGHAGIIVEPSKYLTMTGGTQFDPPANPGVYPAGLAINAAAGTRAREEAIHKELVAQYKIFKGVEQGLKDIIQEAVEADYLLEIEDETLGFQTKLPDKCLITYATAVAHFTLQIPKRSWQREMQNGMSMKSLKSILTGSKKQCEDSPGQESTPTSKNAGTWPYST
jgi:hypothetical protein